MVLGLVHIQIWFRLSYWSCTRWSSNYNGTRFYNDHPSATSSVVLNVGNGGNGVNVPHSLSKGGGTFRIHHILQKYTHDLQHSFIGDSMR